MRILTCGLLADSLKAIIPLAERGILMHLMAYRKLWQRKSVSAIDPLPSRGNPGSRLLIPRRVRSLAQNVPRILPHSRGHRNVNPGLFRGGFLHYITEICRTLLRVRGNHQAYSNLFRVGYARRDIHGRVPAHCHTQDPCAGSLIQARCNRLADHTRLAPTAYGSDRPKRPMTLSAVPPGRWQSVPLYP